MGIADAAVLREDSTAPQIVKAEPPDNPAAPFFSQKQFSPFLDQTYNYLESEIVKILSSGAVRNNGVAKQYQYHDSSELDCPLCGVPLASLAEARQHIDLHYPRDSPLCPVVTCARLFAHPNSVRNHMRIKHPEQWDKMKTLKWSCGWNA